MSKALEAAEWILKQPHPAQTFRALYNYGLQYEKMRRDGRETSFYLPASLGPAVALFEALVSDAEGWAKVAKWMWDQLADTPEQTAMYEAYRTSNVRAVQLARRRRSTAAVDWLKKRQPHLSVQEVNYWRRAVENMWTQRRINALKAARKRMGGTLSAEEQEQILTSFWKTVDEEIAAGALPDYDAVLRRTPSL